MRTLDIDIVIFGSGISGLWLLNRLRQAGFSVLLLENSRLGGTQTINSSGILHGGLKFGLAALNQREQLDDMPALWRDCFAGTGDIDLSGVKLLSEHQYLWSEANLAARATTYLASKLIAGQVDELTRDDYPSVLKNPDFKGNAFRLNDQVVDTVSLVKKLAEPHKDCIYKISPQNCHIEASDKHVTKAVFITAAGAEPLRINPRRVILAGGFGNKELLDDLGLKEPASSEHKQHMVMIKHAGLPAFYGHCLGTSNKPRLSITSHPSRDGGYVWFLGGELAEDGAGLDERTQIEATHKELKALLPWLDLRGARFKTLKISRPVPPEDLLSKTDMLKPDNAFVQAAANNIVVWPVKLTLAPNLGRRVMRLLEKEQFTPQHPQPTEALPLLRPELGVPAWEMLFNQ